jgi:hypothetical protein
MRLLFHRDERGPFYRIRPLLNYPLHSHTRPDALGLDRLWYEAPDAQKKREGLSDPFNVEAHGSVRATPQGSLMRF